MQANWASKPSRRTNDALRDRDGDSPFVVEVKRLARALGVSAHELAKRIGCHQSEVHRHLRPHKERTLAKTAAEYAGALEVDETYLRLVAAGAIDPSNESEAEAAVSAFQGLFLVEALPQLDPNRGRALWDTALAALGANLRPNRTDASSSFAGWPLRRVWLTALEAKSAQASRALAIPLREQLRAKTNAKLRILERRREPLAVLKETLEVLGIDVAPYVPAVSDWALADVWMTLHALAHDDRNDLVALYRQKLIGRDLYRPAMETKLNATKLDPWSYPSERTSA